MKKKLLLLLFLLGGMASMHAQSIVGKWKTIDDKTGIEKSIVEIFEQDGKYFGKVLKILNPEKADGKCDKCPGLDKGKPIQGLVIIKNMKKDGDELSGGKITDPESGKEYKCHIKLNGKDKLDVRGYIGISLVGRTQTWVRS